MLLLLMPLLLVVVAGDDITAATVNPPLVGTLLWDWPSLLANRRLIAHHDSGAAQQSRAVARAVGALLSVANASAGELELIKFRTLTCSHTCVLFCLLTIRADNPHPISPGLCVVEPRVEYAGHNLDPAKRGACTDTGGGLAAASAGACCDLCLHQGESACPFWTFYPAAGRAHSDNSSGSRDGRCCFKFSNAGRRNATAESGVVSGRGMAPASVRGPWSVMNKSAVAGSGDKHDYLQYAGYYWPCNVNCSVGAQGVPPGPDGCSRFCDANNNFCT